MAQRGSSHFQCETVSLSIHAYYIDRLFQLCKQIYSTTAITDDSYKHKLYIIFCLCLQKWNKSILLLHKIMRYGFFHFPALFPTLYSSLFFPFIQNASFNYYSYFYSEMRLQWDVYIAWGATNCERQHKTPKKRESIGKIINKLHKSWMKCIMKI